MGFEDAIEIEKGETMEIGNGKLSAKFSLKSKNKEEIRTILIRS